LGEVDENEPARKIIDAFGGEKRFIGIKVDGKEIFPRQQVLTTPFSINTQHANEADHAVLADKALHHSNLIPVGTIISHFGNEAPQGWLICDGSSIPNGSKYEQLREVLGDSEKLPDFRNLFQKESLMNIKGKFEYSKNLCFDGEVYSNLEIDYISPYTVTFDTRIIECGDVNYAFDNNYNTSMYENCMGYCYKSVFLAYKFNKPQKIHIVSFQKCNNSYKFELGDTYGLFLDFGPYDLRIEASNNSTNGLDGTWNQFLYQCSVSPEKYPYNNCYNYDCSIDNSESHNFYRIYLPMHTDSCYIVEIEMKERLRSIDYSVQYIIKY